MIFTDRKITIRNGKSSINEPVILYRGDYEVSIRFTIMESKFRFKSGVNLVDSEKASFGQLAILAPYGGNVFSEVVKCEDGTVTFTLTREMIDQLEEVGLYSFQIRLFDYYRESRVSIPPVEFGIEVREPVASEDHDNEVNNAIVGYSIAKVVDPSKEKVGPTFDANDNYNKTDWETGDRISEGKLNKIEDALDKINQNEKNDVAALDKKVNSNYNVLDSKIDQVANKGTTVDVIERVTKEEIDRQVQDGTVANLTIAENGVSLKNLNIEDIDNIRFDMYRKVSTSTNEHIHYPTYIYENTQVTKGEETQDIIFRYIFYTECDIEFKLGCKLFSNNDVSGLTGGQSLAQGVDTTSIIAKKGFTTCEFKLSGVLMKYRYHKLLPWIRFTPSSVGSNIDFSLCSVEYKSNAFNFVSKSSNGQLIEIGMDKIIPKQIINVGMLPAVMDLYSNEVGKFIEKYITRNFIELHCPEFAFNVGSFYIDYPVVTMPLSFRNILEPYEYEIPVGTKFEYTVISDITKGKLDEVGLQIFMSDIPNDGSFNSGYGYRSLTRKTVTSDIYKYECELTNTLPIIEGKYVKFFFDIVVDKTNETEGLLKYIEIKFTLPNGEEMFLNPQHIHFAKATDGNSPYIYVSPSKPLLITDYYNIEEYISNEIELVRKEIANVKRVPSKWNGKKYTSVGDSITWQHGATNYLPNNEPLKGYQHYVVERLGCEFVNNGVSGMTMADTPRWTNTFMSRYKTIDWKEFDLVTIALGTNDFGMGSELGNIDSEDTTTFYGAYNTALSYIFITNPRIRVVLMTPWQRGNRNTPNAENKILLDYVEAIELLGEKWSCPVYDAYRNAGWNEKTLNIYTVDGLHGSAEGFKFMGESFAEFMALQ